MKTLLRTLLYLALIVWLGAEVFFPVVAAVVFTTLRPDTDAAGTIVGELLRILHEMGLVAGAVALVTLALAQFVRMYKPRMVVAPAALLLLMMALTAYSQFGVIPAMERDRIAADRAIDAPDTSNPNWIDFNRLHRRAVHVEEVILLLGLATVALGAAAETGRS
jgi:hypothetical protein